MKPSFQDPCDKQPDIKPQITALYCYINDNRLEVSEYRMTQSTTIVLYNYTAQNISCEILVHVFHIVEFAHYT